jgi:hypothetical protein
MSLQCSAAVRPSLLLCPLHSRVELISYTTQCCKQAVRALRGAQDHMLAIIMLSSAVVLLPAALLPTCTAPRSESFLLWLLQIGCRSISYTGSL